MKEPINQKEKDFLRFDELIGSWRKFSFFSKKTLKDEFSSITYFYILGILIYKRIIMSEEFK